MKICLRKLALFSQQLASTGVMKIGFFLDKPQFPIGKYRKIFNLQASELCVRSGTKHQLEEILEVEGVYMRSCCAKAFEDIQAVGELGEALSLFMAASPFILILPDVLPPNSAKEAAATLSEKVSVMAADKVLGNVTKGTKLPDFADSVRNLKELTVRRMHQLATIHAIRHPKFSDEGKVWTLILETYDPDGTIRNSRGWDWNPFW